MKTDLQFIRHVESGRCQKKADPLEMAMKPAKHQRGKQKCQDFCWKVHDHAQFFCFALTHYA